MAFKILYPIKDNTITNSYYAGAYRTGSNLGYNELLHIWKVSSSLYGLENNRILLSFSYDDLNAWSSSSLIPFDYKSATYKLKIFNYAQAGRVSGSFDIEVYELSRSWDEGTGIERNDKGYCNWDSASSTTAWTATGSDYLTASFVTSHSDYGWEDYEKDISTIVLDQIASGNNGFLVKLSDVCESNSIDYPNKSFWSRHCHYYQYLPRIEVYYTGDVITNDRYRYILGTTGSVYHYNLLNDTYQDFIYTETTSILTATVYNSITYPSATFTQSFGVTRDVAGVYHYSISLPITSSITNLVTASTGEITLYDVWNSSSGMAVYSGTLRVYQTPPYTKYDPSKVITQLRLKSEYQAQEIDKVNLFIRESQYYKYSTPVLNKARNSDIIYKSGGYQIEEADSGDIAMPYTYCPVSYDDVANYFYLDCNSLKRGKAYRVKFKFFVGREVINLSDDAWVFKIN